ncbi:hypothetical protein RND71_043250 [Anisodus tanguticus]|uniref:Uncharacterized protein n=1 Tax=Anisodus tanguticus TaxID=243964 RepID=A0AAE1QTM2_9SOLA|nr:hypothetical protein RND71_043250 [Anisodus tanguticus]
MVVGLEHSFSSLGLEFHLPKLLAGPAGGADVEADLFKGSFHFITQLLPKNK